MSAVLMPALAGATPWEPNNNVQLPDDAHTSQKVELVDIDADGWVDIVFANSKGEGLINGGQATAEFSQLLHNDQGTGFTELGGVFEEEHNSWVIKVGDIDEDGDADLVVGDSFNGSMSHVLINEGNNTFTREDIVGSANATIGDLELGDVDGDGDLDILAADWGPLPHGQIDDPGNPLRLWLNDGNGTFSDGSAKLAMGMEVLAAWSFDLELVDINNDYALDIMVSTRGDADPAVVMLNDGEGNFSNHPVPALQPMNTKNINVAFTPMDFDGEGSLDVLTLQDGGLSQCVGDPPVCARRNSVLINDGAGGFTIPMNYWATQFNPGKNDFDAATLDFNNDGKPDFVVLGTSINNGVNARLLINDGAKFGPPALPMMDVAFPADPSLSRTTSLMFADFNHDRREDMAVAQRDANLDNSVLFGKADMADGVPEDVTPPRIYDDNFGEKLGTLLFFGKDAGLDARVNDYKTPIHWHDFQFDTALDTYNLIGDGAALTAHNRRLPYMEMALSLEDPEDIKSLADGDPKKYIAPSIWFGEGLWTVNFKVPYNQMAEDTLTWQYCAIDAAGNKTCLGPFSVKVEIDPNDCGDGEVQEWETCDSDSPTCVACNETCGNGTCDDNETPETCPEDCGPCDNDEACEPPENAENCPDDCDYDGVCGDGTCQNPPENEQNCPDDCGPCDNDGACEPPENATNCPNDCNYEGYCGDDICQKPNENETNCPDDCLPDPTDGGVCGNGVCDSNESLELCPEDCAVCGDEMCTEPYESVKTCPVDCGGNTISDGECPDTAGGVDGQCQLDDDGCGCVAEPQDGTRGLWASLLLFGVFGVRRFRKRA
ncbi:FG-GAP repeat domain-containing protein [Nannocystis punicea]|uniref:VCBS repeat-containing protein n=1 Tax=Nannocystis punicea TaxID=2995304 RepID=A0ABY7GZA0_9BACT|nr:VCBS repeat-containing protein [Nannocystis poenicansa]WAS92301.1 VCBS repeat-containing protein [Nannocystis poenicansa]